MPAPASPSARLSASLLEWIASQAPTLPSSQIDDETGQPKRVVRSLVEDLNDGVILSEILFAVDPDYFRPASNTASASTLSSNWVIRFNNLKRLYKLIIRYFEDVLHSSTSTLPAPNLQSIAKGDPGAESETCTLVGLVLALVVQSNGKELQVERIQGLEEWCQRELMLAIEQVTSKVEAKNRVEEEEEDPADSEFYNLQHERSRMLNDKEALQIMYDDLAKQHRSLKDDHDEALASLVAADARVEEALSSAKATKHDRAQGEFRVEMERMQAMLHKSENELAECQGNLDKQTKINEDLARKVDELGPRAQESAKLKDQLDELRHGADKLKKMENVVEKYKKKLEDQAQLKRSLKAAEEENAALVDKHAKLEDEHSKVSAFKPLLDKYKEQMDAQEAKNAQLIKDGEKTKLALQRAEDKVAILLDEQDRDREQLALYEERDREMEPRTPAIGRRKPSGSRRSSVLGGVGMEGELDQAEHGTTMTELKLKVRQLERERDAAKTDSDNGSRTVVLENLLEDSNRMRNRYEQDYLNEHREKLVVQSKLDQIVAGKSTLGDGPEATIAIRMRLNETVEELEKLKKKFAKVDVKAEQLAKDLTVAKSDLNLVNKDQVDILSSLRASVSVEKEALAKEVDRVKDQLKDADEKTRMQMSQINKLLMDKSTLQSDGIDQRDKALQREKDVNDLKASIGSNKGLSEADEAKLNALQESHAQQQTELAALTEKLSKAKAFIKQQDKMFKAEQRDREHHSSNDEADQAAKSQIAQLTEELERQKGNMAEIEARYRREQQLMLVAWHDLSMKNMREAVANAPSNAQKAGAGAAGGASWLRQQRLKQNGTSLRHA